MNRSERTAMWPAASTAPPGVQTRESNRTSHPAAGSRERGTIVFFWDYDTQWGADRSRRAGERNDWGHLDFENTERLLELHAEYGIPSCFAVVGAAALPGERPYHDPAQVRRIHAAGHEIASHSHHHDWLPGLTGAALLATLRDSKDALEQCIGFPVTSFVPPHNQPFDCARRLSFSLAERRAAGRARTDLARLCGALRETGYRACRVAYRPLHVRLAECLLGRRLDRPRQIVTINGVTCVRLNTIVGFAEDSVKVLHDCVAKGGIVVVYGHPHAVRSGRPEDALQDEALLTRFLARVASLRDRGRLRVALPRELAVEVS